MAVFTPELLFNVENKMRIISNQEYGRLTKDLVWTQIAREMPSTSRKEQLTWLLDTAKINYVDELGGTQRFEDMISNTTEFVSKTATGGLELQKTEFEDDDGGGINAAAEWSRQIAAQGAYWPQKQVMKAVRDGDQSTSLAYDATVFFSASHPLNPFNTVLGTYANIFTGAASGAYPGACPIDTSVTADVALANLQKVEAYVHSIKMPNGEDPRKLRVRTIIGPPAMRGRLAQLTDAKFIAQAGTGGAGSADVIAQISSLGLAAPLIVDELAQGFTNGSDTSYYLLAESIASDTLGGLIYVNREPFGIVYNDGMTDAQLRRANMLQWTTLGRNVVAYGHPYLIFKVKAT